MTEKELNLIACRLKGHQILYSWERIQEPGQDGYSVKAGGKYCFTCLVALPLCDRYKGSAQHYC